MPGVLVLSCPNLMSVPYISFVSSRLLVPFSAVEAWLFTPPVPASASHFCLNLFPRFTQTFYPICTKLSYTSHPFLFTLLVLYLKQELFGSVMTVRLINVVWTNESWFVSSLSEYISLVHCILASTEE